MTLSLRTAATLVRSHVAYTTEETERPLPYRYRRRRAGWLRLGVAFLAIGAVGIWLGLLA